MFPYPEANLLTLLLNEFRSLALLPLAASLCRKLNSPLTSESGSLLYVRSLLDPLLGSLIELCNGRVQGLTFIEGLHTNSDKT